MTLKKVWLLSITFGIVSTVCFSLFYIPSGKEKHPSPSEVVLAAEETETEAPQEVLTIEKGKRALSIAVSDVQGGSGNLTSGSMIDIFANIISMDKNSEEEEPAEFGTYVLQNIKVLAIGHNAEDPETAARYQMITVEVTPEEGAKLAFASQHSLYALLRPEGDDSVLKENVLIDEKQLLKIGGQ
ncbi:hypothetical protein FIU87_07425 [Bacillus sp. THAF10]|uniref:Flp pilus assembly protein CpaB n=1 Tax=Bacillus sp. THAF10 TaxID=2587848 RepID=UPI0012693128|nr:Flp pilus assembly protein CpaB [Bacillus sp. THAF10]QFT88468.1 hypothetical protein FIU87_07425 [Bacillus sp. THAF10]